MAYFLKQTKKKGRTYLAIYESFYEMNISIYLRSGAVLMMTDSGKLQRMTQERGTGISHKPLQAVELSME